MDEKEKKWYVALAIGLMDHTIERVGNVSSADDGHFGVTGWQKKHFSVGKTKITVRYVGKSGVKHEKTIDDPLLLKALKKSLKDKGPNDCVCGGITAEDVNSYLKEFDITAKDIRGFRANQEMCKALTEERKKGPKDLPRGRKERDKILKAEFKKALETVAEVVGHEASTLRSQYLVPGLEDAFVKDGTVLKNLKVSSEAFPVYSALVYLSRTKYRGLSVDCDEVQDLIELLKVGDPTTTTYVAKILSNHPRLSNFRGVVVPVPRSSSGRPSLEGFAKSLVKFGVGVRVEIPVVRSSPVESSRARRNNGLLGIPENEHFVSMGLVPHGIEPDESVLLVDDVITTGSTLRAVARKLRMGGHRGAIFAATAAHVESETESVSCPIEYVTRKLTAGKSMVGTKTRAEKEDDQASDMVNSAPKKKPPRKDLQNHKILDSDPDTSGEDRDLSLNYKRVARRYLYALEFSTQEELDKYLEDHPDADPKNHWVKKKEESGESEGDKDKKDAPKKEDGKREPPPKPKDDGVEDLNNLKKTLSPESARELHKLHAMVSNGDPSLGKKMIEAIKDEGQRAQSAVSKALETGDYGSLSSWFGKEAFSEEKSKKDIQDAIKERDGIAKEIESSKSRLKKAKKTVQTAQQRRDKALEDLKEAESVLDATQKEVDGLDEESRNTEAVKGKIKKLQRMVQDMKSKSEAAEEDLKEAQADLESSQEDSDSLDDARKELDEANQKVLSLVSKHHGAMAAISKMTAPLERQKDETTGFRHRSLERFKALPPDMADSMGKRMESDLAKLDQQIADSGEEVDPDLKEQRQNIADEVSAWRVSRYLRSEKGLTTGLVKALHKADPGSDYIFDLAEGPESPKYRKAVHNAMASLSDDDFVATLEDHAPERVKDLLGPLKSGVYEDDALGGKKVALSQEQASFLRQSVVNAILNDADAEGSPGDEAPGSSGKGSPKGPGKSTKGKTPWWLLQLMRMRGKKVMAFNHSTIRPSYRMEVPISRNPIMKKKASAEGIRRVVATLDNVATLFQEHHEALGIHPKVALDMAERCDRVSDFLQKKGHFDPSTIGKKVPGPLENDPTQKFMAGHFTQANFEQLDSKQESGSLASNAASHKSDPKLANLISKAVKEATLRVLAEMDDASEDAKPEDKAEEKKEEKKASKSKRAAEEDKAEETGEDEKAAEEDDEDDEDDEAEKVASLFSLYR